MIGDYIRELKAAIDEVLEREVEVLAKGCVSDYEEYRYRTGFIAGLKRANIAIDETKQLFLEADDE